MWPQVYIVREYPPPRRNSPSEKFISLAERITLCNDKYNDGGMVDVAK